MNVRSIYYGTTSMSKNVSDRWWWWWWTKLACSSLLAPRRDTKMKKRRRREDTNYSDWPCRPVTTSANNTMTTPHKSWAPTALSHSLQPLVVASAGPPTPSSKNNNAFPPTQPVVGRVVVRHARLLPLLLPSFSWRPLPHYQPAIHHRLIPFKSNAVMINKAKSMERDKYCVFVEPINRGDGRPNNQPQ